MCGRQEGRGSGIEGCRAVRLGEAKGKSFMSQFSIWCCGTRRREQEPAAENVPVSVEKRVRVGAETAAEVVASTVVESVDGCADRSQGVEVPEFVFRDRIQQRAFRVARWLFRGCGGVFFHGFS